MEIELFIALMAGVVLSFFLLVSEIAALRKHASRVRTRLQGFYQSGRILRVVAEIFVIAAFFLVQPVIVGTLVVMALDGLNPDFSGYVIQQLRQVMMTITG